MGRDLRACSHLLSSSSISIPKMCFSGHREQNPTALKKKKKKGKWGKKRSVGGGEEEGDVCGGAWVSVSHVLMRPPWSFRVTSGEKEILDKAP